MKAYRLACILTMWCWCACAADKVIAFSQMGNENNWRVTETQSIREEAEKRGYRLLYANANSSTAKQVADVENLVSLSPDLIVIAPREYDALAPALQAAREGNVPVVLIDRAAAGVPGVDYLTVISADFYWEGQEAAWNIAEHFQGRRANIVQITGTPGSSVAELRRKGFEEEVARRPNLDVIATRSGDFLRSVSQKVMEDIIQTHGENIDAIFGHDDESAIGALQALRMAGITKDIYIVGVGGFRDAAELIKTGELGATILCSPFFGPVTFDTIEKIFADEWIPTFIENPGYVIDATNVDEYLPMAF